MTLLAGCIIFAVLGVTFGQIVEPTVAFTAVLDKNLVLENGDTLIPNKILINYGGGYNDKTGIFTAPKSGIYHLGVHAQTSLQSNLWLALYHNDNYVFSIYGRQTEYSDGGANAAILPLKKGDKVHVKARDKSSLLGRPDNIYTTFTGFRLGPLREDDSE
uniref:Sialic acid binding lectin n=1 Tax=Cepaea hortensis TaxID=97200 RepID=Q70SH0_9EUPU|nr:sialic acid binding lectin [Cepaea hortensis]